MTASCSGCGGRACSLASASVIHTEVCAGGLGTGRQGCICRSMGMAVLMRFSSRLGVGVWETQATLFPSTNCTLRPRSDPGAWHTLWVPRRSTLSPYQTSDGLSAGKAEKSFRSAHPKPYIAAKCAPDRHLPLYLIVFNTVSILGMASRERARGPQAPIKALCSKPCEMVCRNKQAPGGRLFGGYLAGQKRLSN